MNGVTKSMCISDLHWHMCFYMKGKRCRIPILSAAHLNILEISTHLKTCDQCLRVPEGKEGHAVTGILIGIHKWEVYQGTDGKRKVRLGKQRHSHGDKKVPVYLRAQSLQGVLQTRYRTKSLPHCSPSLLQRSLLARSPSQKTRETMYVISGKTRKDQNRQQKSNQNAYLAQSVEAKLTNLSFNDTQK